MIKVRHQTCYVAVCGTCETDLVDSEGYVPHRDAPFLVTPFDLDELRCPTCSPVEFQLTESTIEVLRLPTGMDLLQSTGEKSNEMLRKSLEMLRESEVFRANLSGSTTTGYTDLPTHRKSASMARSARFLAVLRAYLTGRRP